MVGVVLAGDGRRRVLHLPGDLLLGGLFPMHEQVRQIQSKRQRQRQTKSKRSSPWWTLPYARNIRAGIKTLQIAVISFMPVLHIFLFLNFLSIKFDIVGSFNLI